MIRFSSLFLRAFVAVALVSPLFLTSCDDDDDDNPTSQAGTFYANDIQLGDGTGRTWVTLDDDGNPTAIGMTMSAGTLENLPDEDMSWNIEMPAEASATVFKHVFFNWNPHGHDPQGVFNRPHFDFHFYLTSQAEREAIKGDGSDADKIENLPGQDFIPPNYEPDFVPGVGYIGIPQMGLHWTDRSNPAFQGNFEEILIWGSYDGKFTFIEPMITTEFLATSPNFSHNMALPTSYDYSGYYPTTYSVATDAETGDITLTLGNMEMR